MIYCPKKTIQFGQDILDALQGQKVEDQKKTQEAGNQLPGSDQISQFYANLKYLLFKSHWKQQIAASTN